MIFVCNTGPLIALAKLHRISLLQDVGAELVIIPPTVQKELWGKSGPEAPLLATALNSFIDTIQVCATDQRLEIATAALDDGEKEVIVLAASLQEEAIILMDDQAGRRVAQALGLPVLGSAGLLLLAKQQGMVDAVLPLLESLRSQGYWLSEALLTQVRHIAGE